MTAFQTTKKTRLCISIIKIKIKMPQALEIIEVKKEDEKSREI